MSPELLHKTLDSMLGSAKEHIEGAPVLVALIYPGGDFVQGGVSTRNRTETSDAYIRMAASELQEAYVRRPASEPEEADK